MTRMVGLLGWGISHFLPSPGTPRRGDHSSRSVHERRGLCSRQREAEDGAAALAIRGADRSAVRFDDSAADRQPEAGSAMAFARADAKELFEDALLRAR